MKSKLTEKGGFEKLISDSYIFNKSRTVTLTSEEPLITKFIEEFKRLTSDGMAIKINQITQILITSADSFHSG